MAAYAIQEQRAGVLVSNSYVTLQDSRWLGAVAALALATGAHAGLPASNAGPLVVNRPGAIAPSYSSAHVVSTTEDKLLLQEMERIARLLAVADPQFDAIVRRALHSNPEQLYF